MNMFEITGLKATLAFKAGQIPRIGPADPTLLLSLGGIFVSARVSPKAARKAATWAGPAILQGRLAWQDNQLQLLECGFQFVEPKPAEATAPTDGVTTTPRG